MIKEDIEPLINDILNEIIEWIKIKSKLIETTGDKENIDSNIYNNNKLVKILSEYENIQLLDKKDISYSALNYIGYQLSITHELFLEYNDDEMYHREFIPKLTELIDRYNLFIPFF